MMHARMSSERRMGGGEARGYIHNPTRRIRITAMRRRTPARTNEHACVHVDVWASNVEHPLRAYGSTHRCTHAKTPVRKKAIHS